MSPFEAARITTEAYFMHRLGSHPAALQTSFFANAAELLGRLKPMLHQASLEAVPLVRHPGTHSCILSGWRPPGAHDRTALQRPSPHATCEACDLFDPFKHLALWFAQHLALATEQGLWFEDFTLTPDWVHVQTRPGGGPQRIFIPETPA